MPEKQKKEQINILLVDDQYLFLESLKLVLRTLAPDFKIVGSVQNGQEALDFIETTQVDIILMDVYMPILDGVAAVKIISKQHPTVSVIMLTTFEDDDYVTEALAHGAKGYLLKNIAPDMLVSAIRAVHSGTVLIDQNIAVSLIQQLKNKPTSEKPEELPDWFYELTQKERHIIKHILRGLSNKEIAAEVLIGEQTIRNYISSIYDKLAVSCRKDAIKKVQEIPQFYLE